MKVNGWKVNELVTMSYTVEGPLVTMGRMKEYDGLKLKRRYRNKFNSYLTMFKFCDSDG